VDVRVEPARGEQYEADVPVETTGADERCRTSPRKKPLAAPPNPPVAATAPQPNPSAPAESQSRLVLRLFVRKPPSDKLIIELAVRNR
jgi:hypothetical protein